MFALRRDWLAFSKTLLRQGLCQRSGDGRGYAFTGLQPDEVLWFTAVVNLPS